MLTTTTAVPQQAAASRRVKDAPTRWAHWWMAGSFAVAYITGDSETWRIVHVISGYIMLMALGFRVLWALFGPASAGVRMWWQRAKATKQSLLGLVKPSNWQLRSITNTTIGLSIVAFLGLLPFLGLTGYFTWQEWFGDSIKELHELFGNVLLALAIAHVVAVLLACWVRKSNALRPMLDGKQAGAGPSLVKRNHAWLALVFSVAMVAFASWYWQDAQASQMEQSTQLVHQQPNQDDDD